MNGRIQEFMNQVGISVEYLTNTKQLALIEALSELIVKECADVAYTAYWDNPDTVRGIHLKEKIKQHFGVE